MGSFGRIFVDFSQIGMAVVEFSQLQGLKHTIFVILKSTISENFVTAEKKLYS